MATRLATAEKELRHSQESPIWEVDIVNNDLQVAYAAFRVAILKWYPALKAPAAK